MIAVQLYKILLCRHLYTRQTFPILRKLCERRSEGATYTSSAHSRYRLTAVVPGTHYQSHFFGHLHAFLRRPWSFLALSAAGHAGGPPVHHDARSGPGRAPWRVLWAFTGLLSAELEPSKAMENPYLCSTAVRSTIIVPENRKQNRLSLYGVETHARLWLLSFCSTEPEKKCFSHIALHRCRKSSPHRTRVITNLRDHMLH